MRYMLPLLATFLLQAETSLTSAQDISDRAGDLIVVGTVRNQEYVEALEELGMNGLITASLRVSRVIEGRPPSSHLKIRYIAHSFMSVKRERRFRLRRGEDGIYDVCSEDGGRGFICE